MAAIDRGPPCRTVHTIHLRRSTLQVKQPEPTPSKDSCAYVVCCNRVFTIIFPRHAS